jgi:hypothetical protein
MLNFQILVVQLYLLKTIFSGDFLAKPFPDIVAPKIKDYYSVVTTNIYPSAKTLPTISNEPLRSDLVKNKN